MYIAPNSKGTQAPLGAACSAAIYMVASRQPLRALISLDEPRFAWKPAATPDQPRHLPRSASRPWLAAAQHRSAAKNPQRPPTPHSEFHTQVHPDSELGHWIILYQP